MKTWLVLFGIWVFCLCLIAIAGLWWGRRQVERHDLDDWKMRPP